MQRSVLHEMYISHGNKTNLLPDVTVKWYHSLSLNYIQPEPEIQYSQQGDPEECAAAYHDERQNQDVDEYIIMTSSNRRFSALLAICEGNSAVTGEFPTQKPVTRSFDVFFDLRLNESLS